MSRKQWWISAAVEILIVAPVVLFISLSTALAGDDEGALGPGCAPNRPAVPHHAGGVAVRLSPGEADKAPIPCLTNTGWRDKETSIVVSNKGTVLVQSAFPASGSPVGIIRSVNNGKTWDFINPTVTPPRIAPIDMNITIDRTTARIFWTADLVGLGAFGIESRDSGVYIDHSDDDGKTWVRSAPLPLTFDHTQIFTGPPTHSLKASMKGYPNVVYVAVAGGFTCTVFNFCGAHVTRSLDGGATFEAPVALPYPPECPAPGTLPTGGYSLTGAVGRDGTVYVPFTPCERPYVAVSRDGGSTWYLSQVANTEITGFGELGLGMDQQGTLYAAWTATADRLLYLAMSRDDGLTWSMPRMIAAPGVNETAAPMVVAGKRGQVAVAYYGSKNSPGIPFPPPCPFGVVSLNCPGYQNERWDAYITESWDALSMQPLFWSAALNDPADPVWYGYTFTAMRVTSLTGSVTFAGGAGAFPSLEGSIDYFGMTMGPDNTPWAAFTQECPFGQPNGNRNCSQAMGGNADGLFTLVGRLVRVHGEGDEHEDENEN
jgi:hypothetical protein